MQLRAPELLKNVELTKEDVLKMSPNLRNWITLSKCYTSLDEETIAKHILLELNSKCRRSVLERLSARYAKLFKMRLDSQLEEFFESDTVSDYVSSLVESSK